MEKTHPRNFHISTRGCHIQEFADIYRTQVSLGSDLWVRFSETDWLTKRPCWNLTDVTLADEDINSILADNANRAIQGNVTQPGGQICNICKCWLALEPMQVAPPDDQILNQCKWSHLVAKLMQVAPTSGQNGNWCKWRHLVAKFVINARGAIWWPNLQPIQVVAQRTQQLSLQLENI